MNPFKFFKYFGFVFILLVSIYCTYIWQWNGYYTDYSTGNSFFKKIRTKIFNSISTVENRFFDFRSSYTWKNNDETKNQVLVEIDDKSIIELGQWPLPRSIYADLLKKLKLYGAKVVAFDVTFQTEQLQCGKNSTDDIFAKAMRETLEEEKFSIILPYKTKGCGLDDHKNCLDECITNEDDVPEVMFGQQLSIEGDLTKLSKIINKKEAKRYFINKYNFSIPKFQIDGIDNAYIDANEDPDGIFRNYPLLKWILPDGGFVPSLALQAYIKLRTDEEVKLIFHENNLLTLNYPKGDMELQYSGKTKINWVGDKDKFLSKHLIGDDYFVSINEVLKSNPSDKKWFELFKNKIVYIGSTAFAAHDFRHTPVNEKLPGVYFHMNMTEMLLQGKLFKPIANSSFWGFLILALGSILIFVSSFLNKPVIDFVILFIFIIGTFIFDIVTLIPEGYTIPLSFAYFSIFGSYVWLSSFNFYETSKDKAFLKNAFGNYISPELIEILHSSGEPPKLGGDSGVRTAFFTDIQGFSTFSEQLTPTQLVELLNEYLTAMTDILLEHGGTLDKYEGDAIIAFFGAPLELPDHADKAFKVTVLMQEKLDELREKWIGEGNKWPKIVHEMRMRIGVNSGEIVTGNMGSKTRMNYTMMGDSVNLAARLEEAAKQYGIFNHVSEASVKLCKNDYLIRELDTIRVVGKSEPVKTYELMNFSDKASPLELKLKGFFDEGLEFYKNQQWEQATVKFNCALHLEYERFGLKDKTNPSEVYLERIKYFQENPPGENWDGVYTLTKK